ncbi:type II toxin-antitoxin system VapC family toxin [Roseibacillus persicicus]|uniref:PIN domain-containing protein n=1 Tax=Roseibacillus persicicus TaxID=454148 RepID=UPI00398B335E
MFGLDTNVLLRYLTQDDTAQSKRATAILETQISKEKPGFISSIVLVETCWTLRRYYKVETEGIETMLDRFLVAPSIQFEHREETWKALRHSRVGSIDFVDALVGLIGESHGCEYTLTFDKKASKNPFFKVA